MTIDGFCDHTAGIADDEIHQHYSEVLRNADTIIWGRITYQLMESFWPSVVNEPTGDKAIDEFAVLIDDIPKIVYSRTLHRVDWKNTTLKNEISKEEILGLKQQPGKNILVGSPSMIVAFAQLGVVDEYQLCVHPVILGKGLPLFKNINESMSLKLLRTKTFESGVVLHCYAPPAETVA